MAAEAATRSAVPWGVMGNACGMPGPVFCVVKYFHELKIDKADELPVHNRKGVGNQKEKGGGAS